MLKDKVIVITGASRGIGEAIARACIEAGAKVALASRKGSQITAGAEVLEWAGEPLATIEVATVCGTDLTDARERLGRVADEAHVGPDGLWHLNGVAAVA